jgi:hypothetical protein
VNDPNDLLKCYRNVFGTAEGKRVLGDIMALGHFGETLNPSDPIVVAEYNFAVTIGRMAGALNAVYSELGIPVKET